MRVARGRRGCSGCSGTHRADPAIASWPAGGGANPRQASCAAALPRGYIRVAHQEVYMSDTLFSKIIRREIPAEIVFENAHVVGFRDLNPQAPLHVLFGPRETVPPPNDLRHDPARPEERRVGKG